MKLNMDLPYCNILRLERTRMNYATPGGWQMKTFLTSTGISLSFRLIVTVFYSLLHARKLFIGQEFKVSGSLPC